ncbi:MAG: electron transfer flavoprotein subunit alpha/FixB family protein, partial [Deltaproteobacteria bacterium]|nr:electron transfer flavoprotein subunit alpha/FixB family protein [Deltaproteobacteria bacterium]
IVEELADLLGGVLAATRPVVDNGWLPKSRQVGQSGKTVKPKLYNSHHIVAINNDPQAPIFNIADEAILGDVLEVVPALINKIKASSHG